MWKAPTILRPIHWYCGPSKFASVSYALHITEKNIALTQLSLFCTVDACFVISGGPGCSGLIGFFTEHGPFRVNENLDLVSNPFAWNAQPWAMSFSCFVSCLEIKEEALAHFEKLMAGWGVIGASRNGSVGMD